MAVKLAAAAVVLCIISLFATTTTTVAEDPYRFFNWNVTYGDIYPLGLRQRVSGSLSVSILSSNAHTHTRVCLKYSTLINLCSLSSLPDLNQLM